MFLPLMLLICYLLNCPLRPVGDVPVPVYPRRLSGAGGGAGGGGGAGPGAGAGGGACIGSRGREEAAAEGGQTALQASRRAAVGTHPLLGLLV
jgi:hypothetical protein